MAGNPVGSRLKPACDGNKQQARGRVKTLVSSGQLPKADMFPCTDCGHDERIPQTDRLLRAGFGL